MLGATNRPQAIDSALLRPGRFDVHLYVPPPDCLGRLEILHIHTRGMPLAGDVNLQVGSLNLSHNECWNHAGTYSTHSILCEASPAHRSLCCGHTQKNDDHAMERAVVMMFRDRMWCAAVQSVADRTELYTGAELEGLCREAALTCLRENLEAAEQVAGRHFEAALGSSKPSLTSELLADYAQWKR